MKHSILAVIIFISINSFAQIDSMKLKTSVSLQARDWLYLNSYFANNAEYENIYDTFKLKARATTSPTFTTVIKVDSVRNEQIIRLAQILRQTAYSASVFVYSRINTALRSTPYLIQKIDAMDADYTTQYNNRVQGELDKLRAVLQ